MGRKCIGIALILLIVSVMLLSSVSCGQTKEQTTPGQPTVIIQEASWARGYRSIDELCTDQDIQIVAVGVIRRVVEVTKKNEFTYNTRFSFKIENLLKGEKAEDIVLNQMGTPDKPGTDFSDDPLFKVGDRYLLFLKSRDGVYFHPGPWGRYQIIDNKVYSLNNTLASGEVYRAPDDINFDGVDLKIVTLSITQKIDALK